MKPIKYEYTYSNREFVCKVTPDPMFYDSRASVRIYEKQKFLCFNKVLLDTKSFWVSKYATIEDGVKAMLSYYLKEEEEREEVLKKWEKAIDKH